MGIAVAERDQERAWPTAAARLRNPARRDPPIDDERYVHEYDSAIL